MNVRYVTQRVAAEFVRVNHRHHKPPRGAVFALGLFDGDLLRGVAMVGRPVARGLDDGASLEVTRLCTDGVRNGCSMLYARARRVASALGFARLLTYTLPEEGGASLRASGFKQTARTKGGSWSCPSRPRVDQHPTGAKLRWEARC